MSLSLEPSLDDSLEGFRGTLIRPGDQAYAQARVIFNRRLDHQVPRLIARAADTDDVVTVVRHAARTASPLAVRSGGHGADGTAMPDGALVLDMSGLKSIHVDPDTRRVRLEAGVLLGEMDAALAQHGLVVPAGTVSTTGIAGLVLGGGVGHNMRRYGATVDNLLACDVVTADGRLVRASTNENPDLFWALRGGGGNFGVVTSFEFQARPMPSTVTFGLIPFPLDQAPQVMAGLRSSMREAPRELGVVVSMTTCPPLPSVAEELHRSPALVMVVVHTGELDAGQRLVAELAALGSPLAVAVGPGPWVDANRMLDVLAPPGYRVYTKGAYLADLTDDIVRIAVERSAHGPTPGTPTADPLVANTAQNFWALGGAISHDTDENATAFSRADATWFWEAITVWETDEDDERFMTWADSVHAALRPLLLTNVYSNLSTDMGSEWRRGVWGSTAKYQRLVTAKQTWDPTNVFCFNKNIDPEQ